MTALDQHIEAGADGGACHFASGPSRASFWREP
jgi:hypothetical protein